MKALSLLSATILTLLHVGALRADIGYQFVTVGNPGNPNDPLTDFGTVNHNYSIGKYDVTLSQYTAFLNAVAQTDPYSLYDSYFMANDLNTAGISRTGISGSYSYAVIGSGQRPVTYVNWLDAARFTNWLHNGQPTGLGEVAASTEQGAYTLNGDVTSGLEIKTANARYWIPTEAEWYKAAYYDPSLNGGAGGYWKYATMSNSVPGNVVGSSPNQANYRFCHNGNCTYSVSQSNSMPSGNALTDVGAFTGSASAYGTYDQNGDVDQWNDAVFGGSLRGIRGGSWSSSSTALESPAANSRFPTGVPGSVGIRIATVPEPTTTALLLGGGALLARRRRS